MMAANGRPALQATMLISAVVIVSGGIWLLEGLNSNRWIPFQRQTASETGSHGGNFIPDPPVRRITLHLRSPQERIVVCSSDRSGRCHSFRASAVATDRSDGSTMHVRKVVCIGGGHTSRAADSWRQSPDPVITVAPEDLPRGVRRFLLPKFFADADPQGVVELARCVAASRRVVVYSAVASDHAATLPLATTICTQLDGRLLDSVTRLIGPLADPDHDHRLTVVLCDMNSDSRLSESDFVRGCVRSDDWIPGRSDFGGDIIYIDLTVTADEQLAELLAHELAHAAVCSLGIPHSDSESGFFSPSACIPSWLNEGIAHAVERQLAPGQANLQRRLDEFLRNPSTSPILVTDADSTLTRRRSGSRAAATLFVESLVNRGVSLQELAQPRTDLVPWLEAVTGCRWDDLIADWAANVVRNSSSASASVDQSTLQTLMVPRDEPLVVGLRGTALSCLTVESVPCEVTITAPSAAAITATIVRPAAAESAP